MIDRASEEWRRICEARWVLRECKDIKGYMAAVLHSRGRDAHNMLMNDIVLVRPHIECFTKKIAAEIVAKMQKHRESP